VVVKRGAALVSSARPPSANALVDGTTTPDAPGPSDT
jgi:hypothetical protein